VAGSEQAGVASRTEQPHTLRVGLLQTAPQFGRVDANIAGILRLREHVGEVDLAVTPELALNGYSFNAHDDPHALAPTDKRLRSLARGIDAAAGIGYAESTTTGLPRTAYLLTEPEAGVSVVQHKIHPVSYAPWNEHLSFQAGETVSTASIGGVVVGSVICNDMWHPVVPWLAVQAGAEVIVVPVASMEGADPGSVQRTWQVILEHAALLLQCYIVFVNRCGTDDGARFWGGSRVLGPDGNTLARLDDTEGAVEVTLDLTHLRDMRRHSPVLAESRPAVIADILARVGKTTKPAEVDHSHV
jgi:predicted amidohydrolase